MKNLGNGYYQFNWKAPAAYRTTCKTLNLNLSEGVEVKRMARFIFLY